MKIYKTLKPLILGSGSPRRNDLLKSAGLEFEIHPATCDEPAAVPGLDPESYAIEMALLKAENVAAAYPDRFIIGSDTIVVRDNDILGKPSSHEDAFITLKSLCGRKHKVISGCAFISPDGIKTSYTVSTDVEFIDFNEGVIRAYAATGEPDDKAGAYAIQGQGAFLVKSINGSYTNVVGLPLSRVIETLVEMGVAAPPKARSQGDKLNESNRPLTYHDRRHARLSRH
ncbi:Maf family protein [Maridesulfovibrio hydrothermalis]|uniref:dTTP/UTP pyrophosphatase n=1 Tax=Maridesulfovibrio hydrothermalis AM13 = DSM 14728 TaxID=1121451 RepID=L0RF84_9BACT|nr:Maf family protein [Maridesulfovibrio hydrothermalis]CCO24870.1 Maf-like protein DVU_0527 [Maridesulfovibrio hydrothermalis AM13 = DSM 14728]